MTVSEKVSYLKGLAEGVGLDESVKQDKLIKAIIDVLVDMAVSVDGLEAELEEIREQVDAVDEDLASVEEDLYDDYDEDEDEDDCCGDSCCCYDDDDDFIEVECPVCGKSICIDPTALEETDTIVCPNCKTDLEFDFSDEDDEQNEDEEKTTDKNNQ